MSFGDAGLDHALEQSLREQAGPSPGKAFLSEFLMGLTPGAGMADASGGFPNMQEGGTYPGWRENLADGNYGMAGMQGLGSIGDLLTFLGPMGLAAGAVARAPKAAARGVKAAKSARKPKAPLPDATTTRDPAVLGYDPDELAVRYPHRAYPAMGKDKSTGKLFPEKALSEEAEAVARVRQQAQKDISAGNYEPHFRVEDRYDVDPSFYPVAQRTDEVALPRMQKTVDRFKQEYDTPEIRQRLNDAYDAKSDLPSSHSFYAMGQLEEEFIRELGPDAGRAAFRQKFSHPMAATTGGADPTGNLLMANYGNYMQTHGSPIFDGRPAFPAEAFEMHYPVGGRYARGNMEMYDNVLNHGQPMAAGVGPGVAKSQPKRHNFAANFEGHLDRSTIDEQMMRGFDPSGKLKAPKGDSYGVLEGVLNDVAIARGETPGNFQSVGWTGFKGSSGKPMIQDVNEAIERTRRVTGLSAQEIVRNMIHGRAPLYGGAGAGIGLGALLSGEAEKQQSLVPDS